MDDRVFDEIADLQAHLDELKSHLIKRKRERNRAIKDLGVPADVVMNDPEALPLEIKRIDDEIRQIEEERSEIKNRKIEVEKAVDSQRLVDKYKSFSNIRALLKEKDFGIGHVEKLARVRIGYVSKLDKPESTTQPSLEFMAWAAKLLGKTIDELVYGDYTKLPDEERYIIDFFQDMIEDTRKRKIHWMKEDVEIIKTEYDSIGMEYPVDHALLRHDAKAEEELGEPVMRYISWFYPNDDVVPVADAYYANVLPDGGYVYLVPCMLGEEKFCEVYVVGEMNDAKPLCCTRRYKKYTVDVVRELYQSAVKDASSVYMDDSIRSMIDEYRCSRKTTNS